MAYDGRSDFIPAQAWYASAGTWALGVASNVISYNHTAAADHPVIHIPVPSGSPESDVNKAHIIQSVDLFYSIGTAAATSATVALYKDTLMTAGVIQTAAVVTTTKNVTDAAMKAQGVGFCVTTTITTPVPLTGNEAYHLEFDIDCALTTDLKIYGIRVNYT